MKLYEIIDKIEELNHLDFTENDVLVDTLESLQLTLEDKIDNILKLIANNNAEISALKEEEDRLSNKRKTLNNSTIHIKKYLERCISNIPSKKFKNTLFNAYMQKNAPSLKIEEEIHIPKKYYITNDPVLDKKLLLADIKNGARIGGVGLIQTESLRIK